MLKHTELSVVIYLILTLGILYFCRKNDGPVVQAPCGTIRGSYGQTKLNQPLCHHVGTPGIWEIEVPGKMCHSRYFRP